MMGKRLVAFAVVAASWAIAFPGAAHSAPVLMISIDGLRAEDINSPNEQGLEIPNLRALAANGVSVEGVRGVLPTLTYPSHTTMLTGVHPAKHGIGGNVAFDPEGRNMGGWMWYAEDIKVPTLWDTVKAKGGEVASLHWPVSSGKQEIDYHVPEYWRARVPEDLKLVRLLTTPGLPELIEQGTGYSLAQTRKDDAKDDARLAWAAEIITKYRPQLTTVHLVTLDSARHKYGPDSAEARATLERIDRSLKPAIEKARAAMPDLVVAIVSDHGFSVARKGLNIRAALVAGGFARQNAGGRIVEWDATAWPMSGSAAIVLKNADDQNVLSGVRALLQRLSEDPANGIAQILDRSEIARLGGSPDASFWVDMKDGYNVIDSSSPEVVQDIAFKGAHGFSPMNDKLLTTFIIEGPAIARRKLGRIDLRDIGPTLGEVLNAPLPQHAGQVLPVIAGR